MLSQFVSRVVPETRQASLRQVGVDLSRVERLTFVFRDSEQEGRWLVLAQLPQVISEVQIAETLVEGERTRWRPSRCGDWRIWTLEENPFSVTQAGPDLVAFGSTSAVQWYAASAQLPKGRKGLKSQKGRAGFRRLSDDATHIHGWWNLKKLNDDLFQSTPLLFPFAHAHRAVLRANLDGKSPTTAEIQFAHAADARAGHDTFRLAMAIARGHLLEIERRWVRVVARAEGPLDCVEPLARLSATRQISEALENLRITHRDKRIEIRMTIQADVSLLISGLSVVSELTPKPDDSGRPVLSLP